jgi:hypothetical protein
LLLEIGKVGLEEAWLSKVLSSNPNATKKKKKNQNWISSILFPSPLSSPSAGPYEHQPLTCLLLGETDIFIERWKLTHTE